MEKKIIAICKIKDYKRNNFDKRVVSMLLLKLPLFKLMPMPLLDTISGKIETRFVKDAQDGKKNNNRIYQI